MKPFMNRRTESRISCYLFVVVIAVYILFSPAHFLTTPDEELNLRTTLSLLQGQRGAIPPLPQGFASKRGIDGREYAQYGLGMPLPAAAWCAIGRLIDPSEDTSANFIETIHETTPAGTLFLRWWMTLFTMGITAFTVVLWEIMFRKIGLTPTVSLFFAFLLAFCTYVWPHGRTFFTEPAAAFGLTGAFWAFTAHRDHPSGYRWILLAGVFWAYALLVRIDTVCTAPAALWMLFVERNEQRIRLRWNPKEFVLFSIPFVAVLIAITLYNQYRFDSLFSTGYEDQAEKIKFATPLLVGLHGYLFTPGRSLFLYSPPLLFAAWGIGRLWKRDAWLCGGAVLICAGYLAVMAKWQNWAGGYDWGPRHIYQITPFLMFLTAGFFLNRQLFDRAAKKIGWGVLIAFSVFVQFLGLAADAVVVIKEMVYQSGLQFSNVVLMQFMIYLPQFSSPVLHWRTILNYGPDLLIVRLGQINPFLLLLFILPLALAMIGMVGLWKTMRKYRDE